MRRTRRRRWPLVLLALLAAGAAYLGVAGGAARATTDAASDAASLAAHGHFADAMTLDMAVARRSGPLYVLARSTIGAAPLDEQRVLLAWAEALDRKGQVDEAVAVAGGVTDPRLLSQAAAERATILLDAAKGDAARGDWPDALRRLGQVQSISGDAAAAAAATALLPRYQTGEAASLAAQGKGVDAVALLDAVAAQGQGSIAAPVYPAALLAAAHQDVAAGAVREASAALQRLVGYFGGSPQAAQAQAMLSAPQPVTGTLVDRQGHPVSGQVRLSSHFFPEPGGYYTTGPFYYSTAGSAGTFTFTGVPVGGPYFLEVYSDGDWTTYVDPATGQPATPVTVAPLQPVDMTFIELS